MFYSLQTNWQFVVLFIGLLAAAIINWRKPGCGAWLIFFLSPLYLLKIGNWPLTVLEALMWLFIGVWLVRKVKNSCHPGLDPGSRPWIPALLASGSMTCAGMIRGVITKVIKNDIFLPPLLILAGVFISAVFSPDPKTGLGILKSWFLAPMIFAFILRDIFEGGGLKEMFSALFVSSAAVAAISFVYLASGHLTFDGRLTAFYLSPNHLAMYLAPGLLVGLALWSDAKKTHQRILLFIGYCLLATVLYATYSFGAWLGLAAAAVLILFYLWRLKLMSRRQLLMVICLSVILFIFVLGQQLFDVNNDKLSNLFSSPRSSWQSRLMVWQAATQILKDHGFLGIGPGLFQNYYLEYQQYFSVPYLEWAVPQPHNLFLAWWLQAGLAGLVGFFWLLIVFFRRGFKTLKKPSFVPLGGTSEGKQNHLWIIILMAVMTYFLVHGLVDTTFWKNDLALIWWVIVFLGSRAGRRVY